MRICFSSQVHPWMSLVAGTEAALLLEQLFLLLPQLLVDLGALGWLVAVVSGLQNMSAAAGEYRLRCDSIIPAGWRPSCTPCPPCSLARARSRAWTHAQACWRLIAHPL